MDERDQKILRDLGRYHLGLRSLLALRHFHRDEKALDTVLARLNAHKQIQVHRHCLPDGHSVYQLSKAAALALGFSEARSQRLGSRALPLHLSVLWFCCAYTGVRRKRLEDDEVTALLGQRMPGIHCIEAGLTSGDRPIHRLYNVFVPAPTADPAYTLRKLRDTLTAVRQMRTPGTAPLAPATWLAERRYALAVLVDTEEKRQQMSRLIRTEGLYDETHVLIERSVSPDTLSQTLQEEFYVTTT